MFRTILTKTIFTLRWQLLGWVLAIVAVAFLTMSLYPSFSQNGIENIVGSIPDSLKSLVGNVADFKTIPGYIGQQIFGPNLYIIAIIMAIIIFLGVSASEEADGRLQSLLSFPRSRTSVYFQKWLATSFVVALISASVFVAVWLALLAIGKSADYTRLLESTAAFALLNLSYGLIAFAAAFFTGNKGIAVLIASIYTVASFFVTTLAPAVDKLKAFDKFSLLHYYNNPQIMSNGLDGKDVLVLVIVIAILTIIGWVGFIRRDVRSS